MIKNCPNCGKKLKANESCKCNKNAYDDNLKLMLKMLIKPFDTMKNFINEDNYHNALLAISINLIVMAILLLESFIDLFINLFETKNDKFSFMISNYGISHFKIFFVVMLIIVIFYILIIFITYIIGTKILKSETSIKKIVTWLGADMSFLTAIYLITISISILDFSIALLFLAAGLILSNYYLYKGLEFIFNIKKEKIGYILISTVLITIVILQIILAIFS